MTEQMSQYEKFKLGKLNKTHDDNISANFNLSASLSNFSERDGYLDSNRPVIQELSSELQKKDLQLTACRKQYSELEKNYQLLQKRFKRIEEQNQILLLNYEKQKVKQMQTKQKLKKWVHEARDNLNSE